MTICEFWEKIKKFSKEIVKEIHLFTKIFEIIAKEIHLFTKSSKKNRVVYSPFSIFVVYRGCLQGIVKNVSYKNKYLLVQKTIISVMKLCMKDIFSRLRRWFEGLERFECVGVNGDVLLPKKKFELQAFVTHQLFVRKRIYFEHFLTFFRLQISMPPIFRIFYQSRRVSVCLCIF